MTFDSYMWYEIAPDIFWKTDELAATVRAQNCMNRGLMYEYLTVKEQVCFFFYYYYLFLFCFSSWKTVLLCSRYALFMI